MPQAKRSANLSTPPRVMFYVQYLLGIGHVQRSSLIVQALCDQGCDVHVIFGGLPVANMSFGQAKVHQLAAVKSADAGFSGLVKADGSTFNDNDKRQRSKHLLRLCEQLKPDLIVTETYPFGRRQMRFELTPLLNWVKAQAQPAVLVASIRDILQRRSSKREQECIDIINSYYQHVLVHGDAAFYPLEHSFPPAAQLSDKITYSGYVCPTLRPEHRQLASTKEKNTIVVSIGGGSVGKEILSAALALCQSGFADHLQWLLITGPNMASIDKAFFMAQQRHNLKIRELADDFLAQLSCAYVSISMAGYNTVMDLLLTRAAGVVIPFEGDGETEQMARSKVLGTAKVLTVLTQQALTKDSLQQAIEHAVQQQHAGVDIDNQGAYNSAKQLMKWAQSHGEAANV
jgi:predicted glycosyltransferase